MSKEARIRRKVLGVVAAAAAVMLTAACASGSSASTSSGKVTLEFSQWWAQELPKGDLQNIVDGFEKQNPNITIKLISQPFATLQDQTTSAAASSTLADVVGLDGAWVNPLYKQGALANLTTLMKDAKYSGSDLSSQVKQDGSTYMIPVVNFVYPMFTNDTILSQADISTPPSTRSEFLADAKAITAKTQAKGWILPLGTTNPNGAQNDVMSWAWASGGSMLTKSGKPDVDNKSVKSAVDFVKQLYDANAIASGPFTLQETDKVTQFTNGQVGMMIDSLAHISTIEKANPKLKFSISAIPAEDGYTGKRGIPYASWGIGVSNKSAHKAQAWKFVQYLLSAKVQDKLSTLAQGFPVNTQASPDLTSADPLYKKAFDIYKAGYPANEFVGAPDADTLMRDFDTEYQKALSGSESTSTMLANVQKQWKAAY
jgi:multiple sugar transport system substrate-binding protein